MKLALVLLFLMLVDLGAYASVPKQIRVAHSWSLVPGGGFLLYCAYNFGDKIK